MNAPAAPLPPPANPKLRRMANALRALAMDAVEQAKSGHPGMPMGMADIAAVLFAQFLRFDPQMPDWPDRDRFILSNGHGSMLLYGLLHLTGYPDMTIDEIKRFRQIGSRTAGHPERGLATGIEVTTGPLGQGLGNSVGMAHNAIAAAIRRAHSSDRPSLIACRTVIAYGAPTKAGTAAAHGNPLGAEEVKGARERLGWEYPPFVIPDDIRAEWREAGARGAAVRQQWEQRLAAAPAEKRSEFLRRYKSELPADFDSAIAKVCDEFRAKNAKIATRQASGAVLDALVPVVPELIGGSADLTPSNNTKAKGEEDIKPGNYAGRYVRYGVREHEMAAAMNGMAAHGGLIPYGGTFLTFTDYCRGSIRLSALSHLGVVYVMTHDSIGLGEDGPTHQPIEHLAALRAMPRLHVFRPADPVETAECWALALKNRHAPSILALTRQSVPLLRTETGNENRSARGAYVLAEANGARRLTLLATGSEVGLAMTARDMLANDGIAAAVVSMPCWELFEQQPADYQAAVLGTAPRLGVEAAVRFGWDRWLGPRGVFVGMHDFGASAPGEDVYKHFGITAEKVAAAARALL